MEYPKIRSIDAYPTEISGQRMICLSDPLAYSNQTLLTSETTFFVVTLLDGKHSFLDIQAEYMRRYGDLLFQEEIHQIIQQLDAHFLLENGRYLDQKRMIDQEFAEARMRPAILAGKSYESDPSRLIEQISAYFNSSEGSCKGSIGQGCLRGAIIPHIDYARGGTCYAWAYREIAEGCEAETFIILGTLHQEAKGPFILTRKEFSTPLGVLEVDQDRLNQLVQGCLYDPFAEEIVHRVEHSLELQMVFLEYIFRDRRPVRIVPILCASFHEPMDQGRSPLQDPRISTFLTSLGDLIRDGKDSVCVLASADLAHMGPRFGDPLPLGQTNWREMAENDQDLIQKMELLDGEGFWRKIQQEGNRRRICGVSAIYSLLATIPAKEGRILRYGQWLDPQGSVTFASLAFYG